jgi:hypothetical protein
MAASLTPLWQEFGRLRVVDPRARTVVARDEIQLVLHVARARMTRPADVDRAGLVSWGHVTEGELRALVVDEEEHAYLLHLFQRGSGASVTLFYAEG